MDRQQLVSIFAYTDTVNGHFPDCLWHYSLTIRHIGLGFIWMLLIDGSYLQYTCLLGWEWRYRLRYIRSQQESENVTKSKYLNESVCYQDICVKNCSQLLPHIKCLYNQVKSLFTELSFFALYRMFCVLVIIRDISHSVGCQRFRVNIFHCHKIMSTVLNKGAC